MFKCPSAAARRAPYLKWHPFFTFTPRRVGQHIAWMEWIERKGIWDDPYNPPIGGGYYGHPSMNWDYRAKAEDVSQMNDESRKTAIKEMQLILTKLKIRIGIHSCGCCDGPWLRFEYEDKVIVDNLDFADIDMFDGEFHG